MNLKFKDRWSVQKELNLSTKELDEAIRFMEKKHPLENWVILRTAQNNQTNMYLNLEFIKWLKDVYLSNDDTILNLEIKFYRDRIADLEKIVGIKSYFDYKDLTIDELMQYFDKSRNSIDVAIYKMRKHFKKGFNNTSEKVVIKPDEVKWIDENLFRKDYLKKLEKYKLILEREVAENESS